MLKLLIADDEHIVINTLINLLDWHQYGIDPIFTAQDGITALDRFLKYRPDIIMTDIKMPKMAGLELIRNIRRTDEVVSIIIFSAHGEFEYARQAINLGVADYLLKPIHLNELKNTINIVVSRIKDHQIRIEDEKKKSKYKKVIRDVIAYTEQYFPEDITLLSISQRFAIDYYYLSRLFKKETGKLFTTYLTELRLKYAKKLLQSPDARVNEVALQVGYKDIQHFRQIFKEYELITPAIYHHQIKHSSQ